MITQLRRPGRRRPDLRRRRAATRSSSSRPTTPSRPAASGRGSCPSSASRACSGPRPRSGSARRSTYALELTPEGRGDPIFEFHPDPIRNRAILTSLPGMYWSFPVTRARPGATVLARHGDPRMQNQYGRHVLLASQLYGPGRTVFIGFDSTYRWRYLSEDYFDGFWARLIDRVGPEQGAGRPVPVPGPPGQGRLPGRRPGDGRRPVHRGRRGGRGVGAGGRARGRRPAARAAPVRAGRPTTPPCSPRPSRPSRPAPTRSGSPRRPAADAGLGRPRLDHDLPRRAAPARDRRAVAEPAAPGRPRPAHRRPGLRPRRASASSTTPSPCAR